MVGETRRDILILGGPNTSAAVCVTVAAFPPAVTEKCPARVLANWRSSN